MKASVKFGGLVALGAIIVFLLGCEAKLPEFAGVYVLQNNKYIEIPRVKGEPVKYNFQNRGWMGTDCNVKEVLNRNKFKEMDQTLFNQKGFLVVQNKEWSEFKLFRVPTGMGLKDNEKGELITTSIGYGGGMMGMPFSDQGLQKKADPVEVTIKQAKKGENAFLYVPTTPVEKGCYLVDFKVNGQSQAGWNPILVK